MMIKELFGVMQNKTHYKIINNQGVILWQNTQLEKCNYKDYNIEFIRIVGNPYFIPGYIEITIKKKP